MFYLTLWKHIAVSEREKKEKIFFIYTKNYYTCVHIKITVSAIKMIVLIILNYSKGFTNAYMNKTYDKCQKIFCQ